MAQAPTGTPVAKCDCIQITGNKSGPDMVCATLCKGTAQLLAWSCFGKNKEILQDKQLPISLKKQVMDQCILPTMTYGCQTWSLNKQMTNKVRTAQRAMERKMLDLKLKDKIPCSEIRKRTKVIDIIEYTLKQKWKWAGHIARLKDNRWTK